VRDEQGEAAIKWVLSKGAVRPAGLARANELELKIPRVPPVSERDGGRRGGLK